MTAAKNATARVGVYVRISMDRGGDGLGVQRQEDDCRKLVKRLGWSLVDVYIDNDVSAYSGKARPEWNRLMADVEAGAVNAIAAWDIYRITRSTIELEGLIEMADRLGLQLATVAGEVDLATPTGRMTARIMGAVARNESEQKGLRHKRQLQQAMEAGKPHYGARGFGYEADRVTIIEHEAEVIREVARRVLAGEKVTALARELNDRGVATARGGKWEPTSLKNMIVSARLSGRREHRSTYRKGQGGRSLLGEIVAVDCWPAIITPADSDRLRASLSDGSRTNHGPATGRTYLLSGILRCGKCGGALSGQARKVTKTGPAWQTYKCAVIPGRGGCGGSSAAMKPTDEHVRDFVLVGLADGGVVQRLTESTAVDPKLPAAVRKDEAKLVELAEMLADEDMTRGEWKTARDKVEARLTLNRAALNRVSRVVPIADMVGTYDDLLERWGAKTVAEQRALIAAFVEPILVGPSTPGRFDPSRFDLKFRV